MPTFGFCYTMNFLAHAHLSGTDDDILFGNFIADSVKGNSFLNFDDKVQTGIKLHRQIDSYTDSHDVVKRSMGRVRKDFGRYSGIVIDIFYDHFLAKYWHEYHDSELPDFAAHVYKILQHRFSILPDRTKRLLPFLITQNWLVGYGNLIDLKLVFYGMDRRTGFKSGMTKAIESLEKNYEGLELDFREFYPDLTAFSAEVLQTLTDANSSMNKS